MVANIYKPCIKSFFMAFDFKEKYATMQNAVDLVFSERIYLILATLVSFIAFSFFIIANNITAFTSAVRAAQTYVIIPEIFWSQIETLAYANGALNFSATIIVALLSGMTISMVIYKFKHTNTSKGEGGVYGILGVFVGALGASCPACSVALISLLGVSSAAFLPFRGLELSVLAITLLFFSLYMISKSLVDCKECRIKL